VEARPSEKAPGSEDNPTISPPFKEFLSHLDELRKRFLRILIILASATVVSLFFSERLIQFVTGRAIFDDAPYLALLYPTEGFVVRLKVAFVAGVFLTVPLWFWQVWGFLSPALYKREKKVILPVIIASSGAFLLGASFGFWVLPHAANYFMALAPSDVAVYWSLGKYVDFSLRLLIAFALVFELPLIIYAAAMLGVVTTKQLRKYRRHAYVGVLVSAAIITPPDVFTQIVLAIPLVILYETGILLAMMAQKKRKTEETV
jgi:sec-independent protein translocase protein TatC